MGSSEYGGRRIIQKQDVDLFSNLPDELLSHILSQLPVKWAVRTSILSKRWKKLWTFITCLDFKNHTDSLWNSNVVEFTNFVGHVFRSCNPKDIQKLILHFPWFGEDESSVITWIDEWIKHKVSELDLYVLKLPLSVFSWTTLTVLTLGDCVNDDIKVVSFDLPCLKVLRINGRFTRVMEKLISSCPVLEDLTLRGSGSWYKTQTFLVSARTLKTLVKAYVNIEHPSMGQHFQDIPCCFTLPNFAYLTYLSLISCDNHLWAMLPIFLRSTPSLEVLSLEQKKEGYDNVFDDGYDWVEPKSVAKCVSHHIGVIKVEGFKGRIHELQIVKYFLGSAKVLKTLTVRCQGAKHEEEIKLVGKLLEFSRASNDCKVEFHGNFISNL